MASEERKEAFLRAWFDAPEGVHWAHGMSNEIEQNVSDCFDKAIAAWTTPVAPVSPDATGAAQTFDQIVSYVLLYGGNCRDCADVDGICPNTDMPCGFELKTAVIKHTLKALEYGMSHGFIENPFGIPAPDATGKCGELETVDTQMRYRTIGKEIGDWSDWRDSVSPPLDPVRYDVETRALVTRSQAEELLAAKDTDIDRVLADNRRCLARIAELEADNAAKDAQLALAETSMLEMHRDLNKLEADNAALLARVKELRRAIMGKEPALDLQHGNFLEMAATLHRACDGARERAEALEAKLAAAEKALEPFAEHANDRAVDDTGWRDKETVKIVVSIGDLRKARAALGGKPS